MKLYPNKIKELINYIDNQQIRGLLLYGPDRGYIDNICQILTDKFDLSLTKIYDTKLNPYELEMILNTRNFFCKREMIKLFVNAATFTNAYKAILLGESLHFPVFIIEELSSTSAIKKFFETEKTLASVGCYFLETNSVLSLIREKSIKEKKTIDPSAIEYLALHITGDYRVINYEIEKLFCYAHDKANITLEDVTKVITTDATASGDNLCNYFVANNLKAFIEEVEKLKLLNVSEILMIRALIRYYLNLYIVTSCLMNGETLENSCKKLSPPIFYKNLDNFKAIARNIRVYQITHALAILQKAELEYKSSNGNFDFYQQLYRLVHL